MKGFCQRLLTTLMDQGMSSALQNLGCFVGADQAANDNSRSHTKILSREINRLDWLLALELLNLKWVAIEAATKYGKLSAAADKIWPNLY